MGVDTKGAIKHGLSILEIKEGMEKKLGKEIRVRGNHESGFLLIEDHKEDGRRDMFYYVGRDEDNLFGNELAIHLSLGCWGDSVGLMREVLSIFGGYLDENDCDHIDIVETYVQKDGDFEPSPRHKSIEKLSHLFNDKESFRNGMSVGIAILENKEEVMAILSGEDEDSE